RERIRTLALDEPALSPRQLAVRFTDSESYFVSGASVYRLPKALDLIASPAFIVIKAADEFTDNGRPTSPISRSSAGAGSISRLSPTISRATSPPGSCARQ